MAASFTFNAEHKAAFGAQVLAAPWMQSIMLSQAEKGAAFAEATAPYDESRPPGEIHFKDSFEASVYVRTVPGLDTPGPGRAVGRVTSVDPRADVIENGTLRTPAHHTLRNSLQVMGQVG
jgi:hypothetical protein